MRFFGSVAYDWEGQSKQVLAAPVTSDRDPDPDVSVHIGSTFLIVDDNGEANLVPWADVRGLSGWAPLSEDAWPR